VPFVVRPNGFGSTSPFLGEGPITRTVADAEAALTALNGYDSRDPYALGGKVDYRGASTRSIAGMRIAYSPDLGVYPVDPAVAETVRRAVDAFTEAGATVEEVSMEVAHSHRDLADLWCRLIIPVNCAALRAFTDGGIDLLGEHRSDFPPEYLRRLDHGFLKGPTHVNGEEVEQLIGWCMTYFFNYTGHPAATVPAGLVDGLPVGMQIVGQRYADDEVLAASGAFERLRPWQESYAIPRARPT
jgi:amidase/aspartyl-tRNA(Asn)/glutamyl-tRNA(Gln) amidotransferase subunit A